MIVILFNVAYLSGIAGLLSFVLVIADYFFANYGDCTIDINKGKRKITLKGGNSLLGSLSESNLFVASACGGKGTCGMCKVKVISGGGPLLPTEKPLLNQAELDGNVRLSCQIKVKQDIEIEVPAELFSIKKYQGKVTEIIDYTYDIKGVTIKLADNDNIEFKSGQYVQLFSKKYAKVKEVVSRAYSMASSPMEDKKIELLIRKVPDGIMTTYIHDYLKEGDEISFTGPYGDFYLRDTNTDMIFVAGGSGMAPFKAILEELVVKGCDRKITFFFGARTKKDLFLLPEMEEFEKKLSCFKFIPVLSKPESDSDWEGLTGYIPPLLSDYIEDAGNTEAYLCGSPGMIDATEKKLKELNIEDIYYDSFS